MEVNKEELIGLFNTLQRDGTIYTSDGALQSSGLSPNDRPQIKKYVPAIGKVMYAKLKNANIAFDAVAGIPTGGDFYTDIIVSCVETHEKQKVRRLRLDRRGTKYVKEITTYDDLPKDGRVVLIDDSIWTGESMRRASKVIQSAGFEVVAYVAGTDLKYNGTRGFAPIIPVFDRNLMRGEVTFGS